MQPGVGQGDLEGLLENEQQQECEPSVLAATLTDINGVGRMHFRTITIAQRMFSPPRLCCMPVMPTSAQCSDLSQTEFN